MLPKEPTNRYASRGEHSWGTTNSLAPRVVREQLMPSHNGLSTPTCLSLSISWSARMTDVHDVVLNHVPLSRSEKGDRPHGPKWDTQTRYSLLMRATINHRQHLSWLQDQRRLRVVRRSPQREKTGAAQGTNEDLSSRVPSTCCFRYAEFFCPRWLLVILRGSCQARGHRTTWYLSLFVIGRQHLRCRWAQRICALRCGLQAGGDAAQGTNKPVHCSEGGLGC